MICSKRKSLNNQIIFLFLVILLHLFGICNMEGSLNESINHEFYIEIPHCQFKNFDLMKIASRTTIPTTA